MPQQGEVRMSLIDTINNTFEQIEEKLEQNTSTKEEHVKAFVEEFEKIEEQFAALREERKQLIDEYTNNNWLTKDDVKMIKRAIRIVKSETDFEELAEFINPAMEALGEV